MERSTSFPQVHPRIAMMLHMDLVAEYPRQAQIKHSSVEEVTVRAQVPTEDHLASAVVFAFLSDLSLTFHYDYPHPQICAVFVT